MSNYTSVAMLRCRESFDHSEPIRNAVELDFNAIGETPSGYYYTTELGDNLAIVTFTEFNHLPEGYELDIHLRRNEGCKLREPWSLSMGVRKPDDKEYLASLTLSSTSVHSVFDGIAEKAKQLVESIGRP